MNGSVYNTQDLHELRPFYLSASQSPMLDGINPCVVSSTSNLGRFSGWFSSSVLEFLLLFKLSLKLIIIHVILSHPVPSPPVLGARQ